MSFQQAILPDGRLHLQHGPIDLIIYVDGEDMQIERAYEKASAAFDGLLAGLVSELSQLRQPMNEAYPLLRLPCARHMVAACFPLRQHFITPMAAVAGAVADQILKAIVAVPGICRAYVNNGGDIAVYLGAGNDLSLGLITDLRKPTLTAKAEITAESGIGGIATSGWSGRSLSLGIADAVTVLAANAAAADAAATVIASAVDVAAEGIERQPANELDPDSDLGETLVTVSVPPLAELAVEAALLAGLNVARALQSQGLIIGALLCLQDRYRHVGAIAKLMPTERGAQDVNSLPWSKGL